MYACTFSGSHISSEIHLKKCKILKKIDWKVFIDSLVSKRRSTFCSSACKIIICWNHKLVRLRLKRLKHFLVEMFEALDYERIDQASWFLGTIENCMKGSKAAGNFSSVCILSEAFGLSPKTKWRLYKMLGDHPFKEEPLLELLKIANWEHTSFLERFVNVAFSGSSGGS